MKKKRALSYKERQNSLKEKRRREIAERKEHERLIAMNATSNPNSILPATLRLFFMGRNFFSLYLYYNKKPLRLAGESRRFNNCLRLSFAERNACGFRCRFLSFLE